MATFKVTFRISPAACFGLPHDGHRVLPAGSKYVSDTLDTVSGQLVGYGTLSRFREVSEAINEEVRIEESKGQLRDNYLSLEVDADTYSRAYAAAMKAVDTFLGHLAVAQKRRFECEGLFIESSDGKLRNAPKPVRIMAVATYDLAKLRQNVIDAQRFTALEDSVLERALDYFDHALYLYEQRNLTANPFSRHFHMIISSAFLNLSKAMALLVGDPSKDKDHQSRYKSLGLDHDFYKKRIEPVREVRNKYDVAHCDMSHDSLEAVERAFGDALATVCEVIDRYRQCLATSRERHLHDEAQSPESGAPIREP